MNNVQQQGLTGYLLDRLKKDLPAKEALAMMFPNIKAMPEHIPDTVRLSAVMLLLFVKNGEWYLLAIRRTEDGHAHSGQIGFPGGRYEEEDQNLQTTALRETFEEIGIPAESITVLGAMSPVYVVVSNFNVFPYVGFIEAPTDFNISPNEVQAVLEIRLSDLFSGAAKTQTEVVSPAFPEIRRKVNAYKVQDNVIIWGATAIMMAELELLLREADHQFF
jgi:8-oxo-dGTP pyrophosphatase MutT (NUDIX family)